MSIWQRSKKPFHIQEKERKEEEEKEKQREKRREERRKQREKRSKAESPSPDPPPEPSEETLIKEPSQEDPKIETRTESSKPEKIIKEEEEETQEEAEAEDPPKEEEIPSKSNEAGITEKERTFQDQLPKNPRKRGREKKKSAHTPSKTKEPDPRQFFKIMPCAHSQKPPKDSAGVWTVLHWEQEWPQAMVNEIAIIMEEKYWALYHDRKSAILSGYIFLLSKDGIPADAVEEAIGKILRKILRDILGKIGKKDIPADAVEEAIGKILGKLTVKYYQNIGQMEFFPPRIITELESLQEKISDLKEEPPQEEPPQESPIEEPPQEEEEEDILDEDILGEDSELFEEEEEETQEEAEAEEPPKEEEAETAEEEPPQEEEEDPPIENPLDRDELEAAETLKRGLRLYETVGGIPPREQLRLTPNYGSQKARRIGVWTVLSQDQAWIEDEIVDVVAGLKSKCFDFFHDNNGASMAKHLFLLVSEYVCEDSLTQIMGKKEVTISQYPTTDSMHFPMRILGKLDSLQAKISNNAA